MEKGEGGMCIMVSDSQRSVSEPIDQTEFQRLFVQSQRRIFGHIVTLLPRLTDAEEVFQQTCVIILGKAAQFTPGTDFVRWACQIAQYEVYNYRRRLQGERLHFDRVLLDRIAAYRLEKGDLLEEELDALRRCVEKLSPGDRHLIREQYRRRITSLALAAELGRPANTVYKAVQRIRRVLRECVERALSREAHDKSVLPSEEGQP
jgi:RNA polymerase sigma-70 factor, ECF subfamily